MPQPPPSPATVQAMGYREVVLAGVEQLRSSGYEGELREAQQLWPNYWRLRFALAPRESGRVLELHFDGAQRRWLNVKEVNGVAAQAQQ